MTRPEMEACLRETRATVLAIWSLSPDLHVKAMADDAYKKLSTVLRAWPPSLPVP